MMRQLIASFDVEEHFRIEAAANIRCPYSTRQEYIDRMEASTRMLLDLLAERQVPATFYIVGEIAESHPNLVRDIAQAGHEIGSHGWDHTPLHRMSRNEFWHDARKSKNALEQTSGQAVIGYRAPTFSLMPRTAWAVDTLAELGYEYDSSVFPVRHDRYGIPDAPRQPFRVVGYDAELMELPLTTYRLFGQNLPVGGGGYFRLFPSAVMYAGIDQLLQSSNGLAMLYFHPWEFDADQPRLPLGRLSAWRTYVGISKTRERFRALLSRYDGQFCTASQAVSELSCQPTALPRFGLVSEPVAVPLPQPGISSV